MYILHVHIHVHTERTDPCTCTQTHTYAGLLRHSHMYCAAQPVVANADVDTESRIGMHAHAHVHAHARCIGHVLLILTWALACARTHTCGCLGKSRIEGVASHCSRTPHGLCASFLNCISAGRLRAMRPSPHRVDGDKRVGKRVQSCVC